MLKGSASGDWWALGSYTQKTGMVEDTFTPISYDVHDGSTQALGLQKYAKRPTPQSTRLRQLRGPPNMIMMRAL